MSKMMKAIALLSVVLFLASFFVTAIVIDVDNFLGWRVALHGSLSGWEAAWGAMANLPDASADPGAILGGLHAATNLLLVASLALLLRSHGGRLLWPAHLMLTATLFNASLLFTLQGAAALGYYLWLAFFVGVTACFYSVAMGWGGNLTMSANHPLQPPTGGRGGVESTGTYARRG